MGINPIAAARKEAQRQTYIDEERKLVELGKRRTDAAKKAASEKKEKDLIGAKDAEKLYEKEGGSYYQKQKQKTSDSAAKKAGVEEDVFEKIEREYAESLRQQKEKEKEEEKRWEGFGDIFANPESTTTKNQSNRFSQGTQSKTAEESKQSHYKNTGLRFGVDEDYLDKMIAEAEQKKGKDLFSEAMENSVANSVANITGTADFLIGKPLQSLGWEDNFISEWNSYYQDKAEEKHQDVMEAAARTGKGRTAEIAGEILTFLGEAGIDAALSAFTGGALAAAKLGSKGGKVLKYADDVGDLAKLDFDDVSDVQKGLQEIKQKVDKNKKFREALNSRNTNDIIIT
ncbi:MAG: hypothetical protein IKJ57_00745, partial [Oscillospiraceae bacterium]|nr:hypothetical protein [Oscillospiraceae bacterium]